MASLVPISFRELAVLTNYGILQSSIGFNTFTLESDRFVCVLQQYEDSTTPEVIIVDLKNNFHIIRRPIKADSAIMHWNQTIVALRAQQRTLQIFDLSNKTKLKSDTMNEDVIFWKWISDTTLGLVTDSGIYHWDIFDPAASEPTRITDRTSNLEDAQIINYRTSPDGAWSVVVGISQKQGRVVGSMQLYSKVRNLSQPIEGHAAAFGTLMLEGASQPTKVFTFAARTAVGAKLHIIEIDSSPDNPQFPKKNVDVYFPPDAPNDFPVAMQVSQKYGIIYLVTKVFIHLYDLESGSCIFMNRISTETIFATCLNSDSTGIIAVNRKGQLTSVCVDEATIIPYLLRNPTNTELAYRLASNASLPGADDLYLHHFEQLLSAGKYAEAAKTAANSPRGCLRTPQTIERFQKITVPAGQLPVTLQYFGILLDKGGLNKFESLELVRPVLQQNRKHLIEKWMMEDKLECSEELGDLVRPHDIQLAMRIYRKGNVPEKVVTALAELGLIDQILPYVKQVGYSPNFTALFQQVVNAGPSLPLSDFATTLVKDPDGPLVDIVKVVDIFQSRNMFQQATSFLLDVLTANLPEHGPLQTRLLEMNLNHAPQVADAILGNEMFSHYDRARIAKLCESANLFNRALEHTDDISAIKRMIVHTDSFPEGFLVQYFSRLTVEQSLECLDELLRSQIRLNLREVINIAHKYVEHLPPLRIIELLEKYNSTEGVFHYLGGIVNVNQDKDVHFKYIEAAAKMGQFGEVERICRDSNYYDPEKVKNFLKEAELTDQLPLIIVCDRHNFIQDLVLFLYQNRQFRSLEIYIQEVNPMRAPAVISGLLDVDYDESVIRELLEKIDLSSIPLGEIVSEFESKNRLMMLLPLLERSISLGIEDPAIYDSLAKIYIDRNNSPEKFLRENNKYNTLTIGRYCEKRDPNLAFIAYQKGHNDLELISVANENGMFKAEARYILERGDGEIWDYVLNADNIHRRSLVDQVISTAVPESHDPNKVSVAVRAFIKADMPAELIELLEKIILERSSFSDNSSLQNLLMLTAAKSDPGRLMGYIHQLTNYTPEHVGYQCIQVGLYEEAFEIYKKDKNHVEAIEQLVEHIMDIERAQEYAETVDLPEVWLKVARAQLRGLKIPEAMKSYMRANDPCDHLEVIEVATRAGKDLELIDYLRMARRTIREPALDTAMVLSLARLNRLADLDAFLRGVNVADIEGCGDEASREGYHEAAKILYSSISNWTKLASSLVHLGEYQSAVECARKANNLKVWKQVNRICVEKKEFRLAQIGGLNLIVHAEELPEITRMYERKGYFDELIDLLQSGLGLERAHMGMFTELGVVLSKYRPERVMEHLKLFWTRINIPKMTRACEAAHLWPEVVFLNTHYDEWDNAALTMMEHGPDAWEHQSFKDIIVKVGNLEIYYRALNFYLQQQPALLGDLLAALTPRIDVNRVVRMFEKLDNIPLIKSFLLSVQDQNKRAVNTAINDLLIEEEDYKTLRDSVENFDNFDGPELAERLEKSDLLFFRQIAASIWRRHNRWEKSIAISKRDKLYKEAIETAAMSRKPEVVEELLRYFVEIGSREVFVGMLYACYDLLRPDFVLEISWRHGLNDYAMPFMINLLSEQFSTIEALKRENEEQAARRATQEQAENSKSILGGGRLLLTQGPGSSGTSGQSNGIIATQLTGYPPVGLKG